MGKVTNFSILLNTNRKVFYPGEQIVGQVVVCLSESLETKGIKLVFEGKFVSFIFLMDVKEKSLC